MLVIYVVIGLQESLSKTDRGVRGVSSKGMDDAMFYF